MRVDALIVANNLIGKEFETNSCGKCFVIDYKGCQNVVVMFYEPMVAVKCTMGNLKRGQVSNPFYPSLYGVGYFGVGKYKFSRDRAYNSWRDMLRRCYCPNITIKNASYKEATVCKEWFNFQNYAKWFYSQKFSEYKDGDGKAYSLDKDILVKGNKVYSPETCCFVPSKLNNLLTSSKNTRGKLPLGVCFDKHTGKFRADTNKYSKQVYLGRFNTPEEAFLSYKVSKEAHIKEVASKLKGKISDRAYEALLNWNISPSD